MSIENNLTFPATVSNPAHRVTIAGYYKNTKASIYPIIAFGSIIVAKNDEDSKKANNYFSALNKNEIEKACDIFSTLPKYSLNYCLRLKDKNDNKTLVQKLETTQNHNIRKIFEKALSYPKSSLFTKIFFSLSGNFQKHSLYIKYEKGLTLLHKLTLRNKNAEIDTILSSQDLQTQKALILSEEKHGFTPPSLKSSYPL